MVTKTINKYVFLKYAIHLVDKTEHEISCFTFIRKERVEAIGNRQYVMVAQLEMALESVSTKLIFCKRYSSKGMSDRSV